MCIKDACKAGEQYERCVREESFKTKFELEKNWYIEFLFYEKFSAEIKGVSIHPDCPLNPDREKNKPDSSKRSGAKEESYVYHR